VAPLYAPPKIRDRKRPVEPVFLKATDLKAYRNSKIQLTERRLKALNRLADRLNRVSLISYHKKLTDWEAYTERKRRLLKSYDEKYLIRRKKWEKRYVTWQERLRFVRYWQNKPKRVPHQRSSVEQDNPYWKTKYVSLGKGGSVYQAWRSSEPYTWSFLREIEVYPIEPSGSSGAIGALVSATISLLKSERDQMKAKLHSKFYDKLGNQQVHLANMIAERAQTISLFTSSVKRLSEILSGKKRLANTVLRYVSSPKLIANDILAFKFGIEPLIKDIEASARYLAQKINEEDEIVITVRTNTKRQINKSVPNGTLSGTVEISYVVKYIVDNQFARTLQQFGLVNSAEIAWEMMPWSFVIDWFVPIGRYIQQLSADVGISFKTGTLSEHFVLMYNSENDQALPTIDPSLDINGGLPPGAEGTTVGIGGSFVLDHKVRTVLTEPPAKLDLFTKSPLSWSHGIEALALILQRFPSKKG